jgi:hypothetical protein
VTELYHKAREDILRLEESLRQSIKQEEARRLIE